MKKILASILLGFTLLASASPTNPPPELPAPIAAMQPTNPAPAPTNAPAAPISQVKLIPGTESVPALNSLLVLLIPLVVPLIIAWLKTKVFPEIPDMYLPILAPLLGALSDFIAQVSGAQTHGVVVAALLGSAGVGIRELIDQTKKSKTAAPPGPPPAPPAQPAPVPVAPTPPKV